MYTVLNPEHVWESRLWLEERRVEGRSPSVEQAIPRIEQSKHGRSLDLCAMDASQKTQQPATKTSERRRAGNCKELNSHWAKVQNLRRELTTYV